MKPAGLANAILSPSARSEQDAQPRLLTKKQAAVACSCCLRTIDNLIASGKLAVVKIGASVRIDPHDLQAMIDSLKSRATA